MITGTEDRQHALVALTGGIDANLAYEFTQSPKPAGPAPGPRLPNWPGMTNFCRTGWRSPRPRHPVAAVPYDPVLVVSAG